MTDTIRIITLKLCSSTEGSGMISANSILRIYPHKGHRYELRPTILLQPFGQKCENFVIYYLESVEFYLRFWNDISKLILWIYLNKP